MRIFSKTAPGCLSSRHVETYAGQLASVAKPVYRTRAPYAEEEAPKFLIS
jgi:hypothetical protein